MLCIFRSLSLSLSFSFTYNARMGHSCAMWEELCACEFIVWLVLRTTLTAWMHTRSAVGHTRRTKTVRRILCEHHLYGWSYDRCTASHQQSCEYKHYTFSYVSLLPIERSKLRSIFGVVLCCVSSMFLVWISGFFLRYSYLYLYILGIALFIILVISVQVIEEKWKTRKETLNKTRLWMCWHLHYKYEKFTQIVLFLQSIFRSYCFMSLNTHTHI